MEKSKRVKRDIKREAGDGDDKSTDRPMLDEEQSLGEDVEETPTNKQNKRSPLRKVSLRNCQLNYIINRYICFFGNLHPGY